MKRLAQYKIGFSEAGGIFIGKNIQSTFHQHHLLAIIVSFKHPFKITVKNNRSSSCEAVLIPPDIPYKLSTSKTDYTAFIHLDPYSEIGIKLIHITKSIQALPRSAFSKSLKNIMNWFKGSDNASQITISLLQNAVASLKNTELPTHSIDARVLNCIQYIRKSGPDELQFQQIADFIGLSPSRLSHLFKAEIGLTLKQFILHRKLVKSLGAIYHQHNFTEAAFLGGFSDQPHFNKTFKNAFGIKPSSIKP